MKMASRVRQWFGFVKSEHNLAVLLVSALKPLLLPPLSLVPAQIVNVECPIRLFLRVQLPLHLDQSLAARMNRESSNVYTYPLPWLDVIKELITPGFLSRIAAYAQSFRYRN